MSRSVNGGSKTTVPQQQEIIVDPEYLSQRYAANAPAAANSSAGNLFYADSYYVYDDDKEAQYDDVGE